MVKLKSPWLRGGAARISQYLGHGEIRRGKCQDVVSTATVVLKQASLPQGYEGLSHLLSPRKINMSGKLWGSQEKLKNPDSYVGFSSTSPPTQKCRKQTNHGAQPTCRRARSRCFCLSARYVYRTVSGPEEPDEVTDPGASISLGELHWIQGKFIPPPQQLLL